MLNRPVILVGPMGVGKSTIGKKLAKRLEVPFIDTDIVISDTHGTPTEIFEKLGEQEFRRIESETIVNSMSVIAVIATGGGAVLTETSRVAFRDGTVVYLKTNGNHLRSRLKHGNRPLLKNGFEDWKRIYEERKPIYKEVADIEVDTSNNSLKGIVEEICNKLEAKDG